MIPIIYIISDDANHLQTSLDSLLASDLTNAELVIYDNYNENVKDYLYGSDLPVNIIQPIEKIPEKDLVKNAVFLAFSLFKNSSNAIILNNDFIFKKNWLLFMNYMFINEISENIGVGSVYNPYPINNNIDSEPFFFEYSLDLSSFMLSRRMFDSLEKDGMFKKDADFRLKKFNFISKITSYSYMKPIDEECERFNI